MAAGIAIAFGLAPGSASAAQESDTGYFSFARCGERQPLVFDTKAGGHAARPISPTVGEAILDDSGRPIGAIVGVGTRNSASGQSLRWTGQAGGALCTGEVPGPVDSAAIRFSWSYATTAPPRLTGLRMRLRGVGKPGPAYHVIVSISARVCAVRGPIRLDVTEEKFDATDGHGFEHRQRARCQTFRDHWKLADQFFGIGTYSVRVQAVDRYEHHSRTLSRREVTTD